MLEPDWLSAHAGTEPEKHESQTHLSSHLTAHCRAREATRNVMFRAVSASAMILALVLAAFIAPGSCARPVPAGHHPATHRIASPQPRQKETHGDDPRPLVGVLSQPRYWTGAPDAPGGYIAASYVKWLEAAGARAVPILYTDSNETIHGKLSAVARRLKLTVNPNPILHRRYECETLNHPPPEPALYFRLG